MVRLLQTRVFVLGCGGLGGHVASLLARLGVGGLRLCDSDIFEESNLNRQYFCTESTLGQPKAVATARGLRDMAGYLAPGCAGMWKRMKKICRTCCKMWMWPWIVWTTLR